MTEDDVGFKYPVEPFISSTPLSSAELERSIKPYSLVRPLLVSALRPVVLLPECLAPRLIRNLLDLPSSRLDFQVCPAGESATWVVGRIGLGWESAGWHWTAEPMAPRPACPCSQQKVSLERNSVHPQLPEPPRPGLSPPGWAAGSVPSRSLLGR